MVAFGMKTASGYLNRTLKRLQTFGLIGQTIPEKPNHPHQKFIITGRGEAFLSLVNCSSVDKTDTTFNIS